MSATTPTDIEINGSHGFYSITGISVQGAEFLQEKVEGALDGTAYSDRIEMVLAIADGAIEDGLEVRVNGRRYLGDNQVEQAA